MSHRTMLRHGRNAAVAGLLAAAAFGLTACGPEGTDAAPAGSATTAESAAQGSTGSQGSDAATGGAGSAATKSARDTAGTAHAGNIGRNGNGGNEVGRCTTDGLQAGWGSDGGGVPDMKSDEQQVAAVWLKNISGAPCRISGFPGVQIQGSHGNWDLPRSSKTPQPVVLKPNAHTSFLITLLPSTRADDQKVEPGMVLITPPNEKKHFQLQWPFGGAILDQSGATHPGTYVNPINVQ
ncbi:MULTISPECIES: DUF4232 domain-containing protein [unclassified Streptomyces]|uniref:DUF4232 domain-containing protein n=1 Tax=unclassified Streptomyces TaxID=2593676 RepID=UPI00344FB824